MPAPARINVYNFKGNFRSAAAAINAVAGLGPSYVERAIAFVNQKARIEINFDLGEALNVAGDPLDPDKLVYDYFNARLRFRVVTQRRNDQASAVSGIIDLHEEFVANILTTYEERMRPFERLDTSLGANLLPYYVVKAIKPLGTRSDLDLVNFSDFTDVDFGLEVAICADAWPLGT